MAKRIRKLRNRFAPVWWPQTVDEAGDLYRACGEKNKLTVVNERGRKKMLTKVNSLTFSPNLVEALLSMTALAVKSRKKSARINPFFSGTYSIAQSSNRGKLLPKRFSLVL